MTYIASNSQSSGLPAYSLYQFLISLKEPHFMILDIFCFIIDIFGTARIFNQCVNNCSCKIHAKFTIRERQLKYGTKCLRIPFKILKIHSLLFTQQAVYRFFSIHKLFQVISKPVSYYRFAKMTKRRIPNIMQKTCTEQNVRH